MSKILGIDLGTTNSAMAVVIGGQPTIIENREGKRTTPSIVAISKSGELLIGEAAKHQIVINSENTVFSIKRLMGRKFKDAEVQQDLKLLPYKIVAENEIRDFGGAKVQVARKEYRPAEISAMILRKLKADAEEKLGEKIKDAVITVPAYFDDSQRQATKDAGRIAGFNVKRTINEPTASALAYGFNRRKGEKIAVYDLGGGTFDISILEVGQELIEVKAINGDTHLGGDDLDQRICNWLVNEFQKKQGIDLSKDRLALQRIREAAERAKCELSFKEETRINLPFIITDKSGPKHLDLIFTRVELEELVGDLIEKTIEPCQKALIDAKLEPRDIDEIILVGGQTRMPLVVRTVEELFGKKPRGGINPDEVVAIGAAIQGGILSGEVRDVLLLDVIPLTLGIEILGGIRTPLIKRNTTIPASRTQIFSTAQDNQPKVEIHVLQGEREMAQDNKSLGRFILDDLPLVPRGLPRIEVTFDIDANGILSVSAKDLSTEKEQSIRIEDSLRLSEEEIEKMRKEAEIYQDVDRKRKEKVEAKNKAESLIYLTEKILAKKDSVPAKGGAPKKIKPEIRKEIEKKLEALKKIKTSSEIEAIEKAGKELSQTIKKIN